MKYSQLHQKDSFINTYKIKNGKAIFFESYLILEIDEGIMLNYNNCEDIMELMNLHYGDGRRFGLISNRINSYSLDLTDFKKFNNNKIKSVANAVVSIAPNSDKFLKLESHFCNIKRRGFKNIEAAEDWILSEVRQIKKSNKSA